MGAEGRGRGGVGKEGGGERERGSGEGGRDVSYIPVTPSRYDGH